MELYLAVIYSTNDVKVFTDLGSLQEFAQEHEYEYDYFELGGARQLYLSELTAEEE